MTRCNVVEGVGAFATIAHMKIQNTYTAQFTLTQRYSIPAPAVEGVRLGESGGKFTLKVSNNSGAIGNPWLRTDERAHTASNRKPLVQGTLRSALCIAAALAMPV